MPRAEVQKAFHDTNVPFWKTMRPNASRSLPWIVMPRDAETLALIADRINIVLFVKEQLGCNEDEKRFWESLQAHINAIGSYAAT